MSGKTIISPSLVDKKQNDQLIPQELGAAIKKTTCIPFKKSMILKFLKNLTIYLYI